MQLTKGRAKDFADRGLIRKKVSSVQQIQIKKANNCINVTKIHT